MSDTAAGWRIWTLALGESVLRTPYTATAWRSAVKAAECSCPGRAWPHNPLDPSCESGVYVFTDSVAALEEATKLRVFLDRHRGEVSESVVIGAVALEGASRCEFKRGFGYRGAVEQRGQIAAIRHLYVVPEWSHESPTEVAHWLRGPVRGAG